MTAASKFKSGWCGPTAADWSHRRCPGSVAGVVCTCAHHTADADDSEPEPVAAELVYADDLIHLWHADALTWHGWLEADVLLLDPPYGRNWQSGSGMTNSEGRGRGSVPHGGIVGDKDTSTRDNMLELWGTDRPAVVFGDLLIAPPAGAVQTLIYAKPDDAGIKGARAGFRRDAEAIYLVGPWPVGVGGSTSILRTNGLVAGPRGIATRAGHPHAKPLDVLTALLDRVPPHLTIADPGAGSGSTLIAAKAAGRKAIGVEIDEKYAEIAAKRLSQEVLTFDATA